MTKGLFTPSIRVGASFPRARVAAWKNYVRVFLKVHIIDAQTEVELKIPQLALEN